MKRSILAAVILALCQQAQAGSAPAIHYAPAENLEHIDVALIDSAKREIDLAAYVLTDWPVMQALTRAADRDRKSFLTSPKRRASRSAPSTRPGAPTHLKSY